MKQRKRGQAKESPPKRSLNLPHLDQSRSAVLNSLPSKESQRGYRHAIDEFIEWYCSEPETKLPSDQAACVPGPGLRRALSC